MMGEKWRLKLKRMGCGFVNFFWPKRCAACQKLINFYEELCDDCKKEIRKCPFSFIYGTDLKMLMADSLSQYVDGICTPFYYEGSMKLVIYSLKFSHHAESRNFLVRYICNYIDIEFDDTVFDFITAVPMYRSDMRKRGENHSEMLARLVGTKRHILYQEALKKVRRTKTQHKLSKEERMENIRGAYAVRGRVEGKTVLLIDDVVTTGATANECAKVLKRAGAKAVYVAAGAKTSYRLKNIQKNY